MEIAREIEYQRRSKLLKIICREYNLTEGRVSEKLLESDILINHQLEVSISYHKIIIKKNERHLSLIGCAKYDKIDRGWPTVFNILYYKTWLF